MSPRGMNVADVRKALGQLRSAWDSHAIETPINPSEKLFNGMTMSNFAYAFVFSHHEKRHQKVERK